MTEAVFQFKAIAKRLNCQEQKAEFEEKNPPVDLGMYGYPSNLTPMAPSEWNEAARKYMAENAKPLTSLAHPAWPYTGTPHEWRIKI